MNNLLTVQDVMRISFRKAMRGYDTNEVDRFLDDVLDALQKYGERTNRLEQELIKNRDKLDEFDKLRAVMHDTLLMAQKSADEKIAAAQQEADKIIAEAEAKAESIRSGAFDEKRELCDELARIKEVRNRYMTEARALIARFDDILCNAANISETAAEAEEIIVSNTQERTAETQDSAVEETADEDPEEAVEEEAKEALVEEPEIAAEEAEETVEPADTAETAEETEQPAETAAKEISSAQELRFEYKQFSPAGEDEEEPAAEEPQEEQEQNDDEFRLFDSEELIKADTEEAPAEKSEEELSDEQLAAAEQTSFADENQSNLFGDDADPTRLRKEIRYAKADSLDD